MTADSRARRRGSLSAGALLAAILLAGTAAPAGVRAAAPARAPGFAPAEAPALVTYQGRFAEASGDALTGPVDLEFRLYDGAEGGSPLWTESHAAVELADGVASVLLGSLTPFPPDAFAAPGRYLEIVVDGTPLAPRLTVTSVPFALEADRLDGHDAAAFETAGAAGLLADSLAASDGTPPNEDTNRVHWDNLAGVPAGFADGTDDGSGGTGPVTGADVVDSTLTADDIAPGSVTGDRLATRTVTGGEIALETVTGDHILDDAVRSADILDGTVGTADLADGGVESDDLAGDAVTGAKILDGAIQPEDLGFTVGDLTGVIVAGGLSGGGLEGDVTLSVGAGPGIQVTGSSVSLAPAYYSGSAYDGRFVSQGFPSWQAQPGAVTVPGAAFRPATPTGKYTVSVSGGYLFVDAADNAGAEDEFTAGIQLPDGAEITGFSFSYWDDSAATLSVSLRRARHTNGQTTTVASAATADATASWRTGSDSIITETSVDNDEFTYWVAADFPSVPEGDALRLLSVRVSYSVSRPY